MKGKRKGKITFQPGKTSLWHLQGGNIDSVDAINLVPLEILVSTPHIHLILPQKNA